MNKYLTVLLVAIIFSFNGCAVKAKKIDMKLSKIKIGKKAFEAEDEYILKGLYYAQNQKYLESAKVFETLYSKSKKDFYLIEALKLIYHSGKFDSDLAKKIVKKSSKVMNKNLNLKRMVAIFHLYKDDLRKSEKLAMQILKKDSSIKNYHLIALIKKQKKEYQKSYDYFMKAYKIKQDDESIKSAFDIQYNFLLKREKAKELLQTHIKRVGCSKEICTFLAKIHAENGDFDSMASIYEKLSKTFKNKAYNEYLIEIYMYQKKYDKAIKMLEDDNNLQKLMKVYAGKGDFLNASKTAKKLYKEDNNAEFLALEAIYEYEYLSKISNFTTLDSVLKKFKIVLASINKAEYLNYYGYLLIDHNIDVKDGILQVQKALKLKPKSSAYLDSLAWGLYKDNRCKEAYEIMKKLVSDSEDAEIIKHYKIIKKCK